MSSPTPAWNPVITSNKLRILGLIPARGGSKRLPGKNIKPLGDFPLIAWTIQSAIESGVCTDVVVSTDDPEIAELSVHYAANVPGLRPLELATDTATSVDVAIYELDRWEQAHGVVDGLMLLQPTSPFRKVETIRQAVHLFDTKHRHSVVGVSPVESHPAWCFRIEHETLLPLLGWEAMQQRSQDLPALYVLNGAIYLVKPEVLRAHRSFITEETFPLVINDPAESLDIDTPWDWELAELLCKRGDIIDVHNSHSRS